jgi:adenine-specific DNA glycosylase
MRKGNRWLLAQRRADAERWAGFWEFPQIELRPDELANAGARRLLRSTGISAKIEGVFATLVHTVTHHRIRLAGVRATWRAGRFRSPLYDRAQWVSASKFGEYPAGTTQRKMMLAAVQPTGLCTSS